ncbi:hypothetical protein [Roseibium salinum]|uniref:Uncharacterized protein n=1 Tax=Roseibium salinum TaxID=1604349 RepID=A0ABT3R940_9HYPH|nr:hypothetical protein [Roseibium sp. DSM 29163]MCX2725832.1 hypothetical protein [Roseibium sp. DSM 29163]
MFGFVNVVEAALRETTRTADTSLAKPRKPVPAETKPVKSAS